MRKPFETPEPPKKEDDEMAIDIDLSDLEGPPKKGEDPLDEVQSQLESAESVVETSAKRGAAKKKVEDDDAKRIAEIQDLINKGTAIYGQDHPALRRRQTRDFQPPPARGQEQELRLEGEPKKENRGEQPFSQVIEAFLAHPENFRVAAVLRGDEDALHIFRNSLKSELPIWAKHHGYWIMETSDIDYGKLMKDAKAMPVLQKLAQEALTEADDKRTAARFRNKGKRAS